MYSFEIDNILKQYNYNLPSDVYLRVFDPKVSTQISHTIYNPWGNYFSVWTNDNCHWEFKVYPVVIQEDVVVPCEEIIGDKIKKLRKSK